MNDRAGGATAVWVLAGATLLTTFAGAAIVVALDAQSGDAQAQQQSAASAAGEGESSVQEAQEGVRSTEARLRTAGQTAENKASELADARYYCDLTDNAIAFANVRWCEIQGDRYEELVIADRDLARYTTEVSIAEDQLVTASAASEAAHDELAGRAQTATTANAAYSAAFASITGLAVVLAITTALTFVLTRKRKKAPKAVTETS
jgi:hypothetical protein